MTDLYAFGVNFYALTLPYPTHLCHSHPSSSKRFNSPSTLFKVSFQLFNEISYLDPLPSTLNFQKPINYDHFNGSKPLNTRLQTYTLLMIYSSFILVVI